jgi:hypothetical protein
VSPCLPLSLSPCLRFSVSPFPRFSLRAEGRFSVSALSCLLPSVPRLSAPQLPLSPCLLLDNNVPQDKNLKLSGQYRSIIVKTDPDTQPQGALPCTESRRGADRPLGHGTRGLAMKQMILAIVAAGLLVAGSILPAEAASGRGGGSHGGSRSHGGSVRGSVPSHGGGAGWVGRGVPGGSGWHGGARFHGSSARWHGHGYYGGSRWHGGTRVFIGGSFGWWGWPAWWGPGWWGAPYPYYSYYPYYSAPPVAVQPAPAPPVQDYWYYCQDAGAYYPYVKECPGGWIKVVPSPAPPGQ